MERRRARSILLLAIVLNLAMLFVFKYFNMLVVVLENMIGMFSGAMGCGQAFGAMFSMQRTGVLGDCAPDRYIFFHLSGYVLRH